METFTTGIPNYHFGTISSGTGGIGTTQPKARDSQIEIDDSATTHITRTRGQAIEERNTTTTLRH